MRQKICYYIKQNIGGVFVYTIIIFIFRSVLYLHNISPDIADYAVVLSLFLLAIVYSIGCTRYVGRLNLLEHAFSGLPCELGEFPAAKGSIEVLYENRVQALFSYKEEMENGARLGRQEMLDYYSLWAHQIKTPISAMRLLLQAQSETDTDYNAAKQETDFLQPMRMELFKTEQYVEMVLSYLRLEEMASDLTLQWYDIDDIVRQAVRKYSQLFILKKIKLEYQTCSGKVLTDEKWLLLVLEQLLSNALKYTGSGQISIYMDSEESGVLVVEDTGMGIQPEDLPRIFEKGFTGYNGRQDKKATGIGLYLCKSVCDKLNHKISIESELGKGTKVRLGVWRDVTLLE